MIYIYMTADTNKRKKTTTNSRPCDIVRIRLLSLFEIGDQLRLEFVRRRRAARAVVGGIQRRDDDDWTMMMSNGGLETCHAAAQE